MKCRKCKDASIFMGSVHCAKKGKEVNFRERLFCKEKRGGIEQFKQNQKGSL